VARSADALFLAPLILLVLPAVCASPGRTQESREEARAAEPAEDPPAAPPADGTPLVVSRGEGWDPVVIPRDEELDYIVEIDVGLLGDLRVGEVTLSSGQEPYFAGLPPPGESVDKAPPRQVGWIRSQARGAYLGYELRHELEARHLPQTWPSVLFRDTQAGSENRRRELKLGVQDGRGSAVYRHDGHCKGCANKEHFVESAWMWGKPYHCEKCKRAEHRVWSEPEARAIPEGTVDLLTAVYLARAMIQEGRKEATFPVIDKKKLWVLTVTRGPSRTIETPAGKFHCLLAQLSTQLPAGEPSTDGGRFQGLFGIQGTIRIWMEAETGIPVTISGELPVPVVSNLDVNVRLSSYKGTPGSFTPIH
jgi:hypothetical protein